MQETSTVIQGMGNEKVVNSKGTVDIMVQCPETEQGVRWRFLALYCPSCPVNLISLSAIGTRERQELKFRNSREGWNGEFTISSPHGKTHRLCAKEHPRMHGIVCVEVLKATHTTQVGVPEKPTMAETSVCEKVRVHASLTKALSSIIAEDGTRGVQELEEDTLSRCDTMRGANDLEANPLPRENTMGGVRELEEAAYARARRNLHQHAALGHFADGRKLKQAVEAGMSSLSGVGADFFDEAHAKRCTQCRLSNTRSRGISHKRVDTSKVAPFAHFKCDFVYVSKMELSEDNENIASVLGHTPYRTVFSQEGLMFFIGLPRTGTMSLIKVLEQYGFRSCQPIAEKSWTFKEVLAFIRNPYSVSAKATRAQLSKCDVFSDTHLWDDRTTSGLPPRCKICYDYKRTEYLGR